MSYNSKIKMSIGWIYPIGIFTSYILLIIEFQLRRMLSDSGYNIWSAPWITVFLVALMFIVLGIIQWFRYRLWIHPVLGALVGFTTAQMAFIFPGLDGPGIVKVTYFISFITIIIFIIVNWNAFYRHERFEANSRRLFRLASERIQKTGNGFTDRPYSGGRIELNKEELAGFARYLHSLYIVRPFYYEDYICLSFSMNRSLMVIEEGSEVSNIKIGFDGSVTVKVSAEDYRDFHERLSFDQLCSSLSAIFIHFLDYYRRGVESRIQVELKASR